MATRKQEAKSPAEIEAMLKKAKPLFEKRDKAIATEVGKWQREIEMLEGRVQETYELELMGGKTITMRTYLTNDESKRLGEIRQQQLNFNPEKDNPQVLEDVMYEILGIVTANPDLTADWWRQHEGKFAMVDAVTIAVGYYEKQVEMLKERNRRVRAAQSFREDGGGTELRDVPPVPGDRKP